MNSIKHRLQQSFNSTFKRKKPQQAVTIQSSRTTTGSLLRKNIIITAHGARMPAEETLRSAARWDAPTGNRKSQWFKVKKSTSIYFPVEATSGVAGGCSIFGTTGLESARKICSLYDKYTGKQDLNDQILKRYGHLYLNEGAFKQSKIKIPSQTGDWADPDLQAFATADPSSNPLFEKRDCIPNMILEVDNSPGQKASDYAVYECSGGGDMKEIRLISQTSSLEEEVKHLEKIYPNYELHIYVYACMVSIDHDVSGNLLPFLRPATETRSIRSKKRNPQGINALAPHEVECDVWAKNELSKARIKDNNRKLYREWMLSDIAQNTPDEYSLEALDNDDVDPSKPGGYLFPTSIEDFDKEDLQPSQVTEIYGRRKKSGGRKRRTRKVRVKGKKSRRRKGPRKR